MTSRAVCSIASRARLPQARALAQSVRARHPDVAPIVLLADRPGVDASDESFELVSIDAVGIADLPSLAFRSTERELIMAVASRYLRGVLDRGVDRLLYVDCGLAATGPLDAIFERLDAAPIVMTPHLARDGDILNRGLFALRRTAAADRFLEWLAGASGSLDVAPALFAECTIERTAPWPVSRVSVPDDEPLPRGYDRFDDGVAIAPVLREIHRDLGDAAGRFGDPFGTSFVSWLRESPDGFAGTNLVGELWKRRGRIPGAPGEPRAFVAWLQEEGWARLELDPSFIPRTRKRTRLPAARRRAANVWTQLLSPEFCKACLATAALDRLGLRGTVGRLAEAVLGRSAPASAEAPGRESPGVRGALRRALHVCGAHDRVSRLLGREKENRPPAAPVGINLAGYFTLRAGLGEAARLLARALAEASIPHALINWEGGLPPESLMRVEARFAADNPHAVNVVQINPDRVAAFAGDRGGRFFAGRYNVGLWMWEQPSFPREWRPAFGFFDEIWAATSYAADAIAQSSPVPVVRVPIPLVRHAAPPLPRSHFGLRDDEFVVLFIFDAKSVFERKNPFALIEAFRSALGGRTNARLVIKWSDSPVETAPQERLRAEGRDPRLRLIERPLTRQEIDSLYACCDVYASLHRAEGFGLTIAEAMLAGRPVIATDYSGNTDFMLPSVSLPVRYRLVALDRDLGPYRRGCEWADPDVGHAAEQLRWVYEHPAEARAIGEAARRHMEERWSPAAVGRHVAARLRLIGEGPVSAAATR